jgi:hypothetical protein
MRRATFAAGCAVVAFSGPAAAGAEDGSAPAFFEQLFRAAPLDPATFSDAFTNQIPIATVQALVAGYRSALGALESAAPDASGYLLTFERGTLRATVAFEPAGKVTSLSFLDERSPADRAALERLLRSAQPAAVWFAPSFLARLPLDALSRLLAKLHADEGAFVRVDERSGGYYSVFEHGESRTQIATDAAGKIRLLYFARFAPTTTS